MESRGSCFWISTVHPRCRRGGRHVRTATSATSKGFGARLETCLGFPPLDSPEFPLPPPSRGPFPLKTPGRLGTAYASSGCSPPRPAYRQAVGTMVGTQIYQDREIPSIPHGTSSCLIIGFSGFS
jgi:hypothetical protein